MATRTTSCAKLKRFAGIVRLGTSHLDGAGSDRRHARLIPDFEPDALRAPMRGVGHRAPPQSFAPAAERVPLQPFAQANSDHRPEPAGRPKPGRLVRTGERG